MRQHLSANQAAAKHQVLANEIICRGESIAALTIDDWT